MKNLLLVLAAAALIAACGGNVVVDGTDTGTGAASSTGTSTTTTDVSTLPSGACPGAPPAGSLTLCGGSSGTASSCSFAYCDAQGTQDFTATCTATSCQCFQGTQVLCTCALTSAGNICTGTPDCCFGL